MRSDDLPRSLDVPHRLRRWLDGSLVIAIVAAASVLSCQELCEADAWWHLRSGDCILENGHLPARDPFSFTSADRPWIDLHWGFQVAMAMAHRVGGVSGMIVLTSAVCGLTLLLATTARMREWPAWVVVAVWVPALLLMCTRVPPRPEVFSLAFLAAYMAVLLRCDRRPALAWILPAIQVLWVNTHALFILGPIVLGAYVADGAFRSLRPFRADVDPLDRRAPRWWVHVGLASVAVLAACLLNPYGVRGALFPLELFPKIGPQGGLYKANIIEFQNLNRYLQDAKIPVAERNLIGRVACFLFIMLPISILVPAVSNLWTVAASRDGRARPASGGLWLIGLAFAVGLAIFASLSLPLAGTPGGLIEAARWASLGFLALGLVAAASVVWRSRLAAMLAACGGLALASGLPWLQAGLLGRVPSVGPRFDAELMGSPWFAGTTAVVALLLTLRAGGRLFRIVLAVAFGYLALQAIRNVNLFAVVAGFVIATELGGWIAKVVPVGPVEGMPDRRSESWGLVVRVVMSAAIGMGTVAVATGRLPSGCRWPFTLGLRETPSIYAHKAALFAGRPGMPRRCLALGLDQAAVYLYHNGPTRKLFMDPRLEVASEATFATYLWIDRTLNQGRPGWSEPLERMGDPSILIGHKERFGAEATLLADPRWRCVYFDGVASLFLPSGRKDQLASFPTIDFADRHFRLRETDRGARGLDEAVNESLGLVCLGQSLPTGVVITWTRNVPILLLASDRAREALAVSPEDPRAWLALACALWLPPISATGQPGGPSEAWDPALALAGVQSIHAFRSAAAFQTSADEVRGTWSTIQSVYRSHGMSDAAEWAGERSKQPAPRVAGLDEPPRDSSGVAWALPPVAQPAELAAMVENRLERGRAMAAVALVRQAQERGMSLPWNLADRAAVTHLYLGQPAEARRYWKQAQDAPSPALRLARIAQAEMALNDLESARKTIDEALAADRQLGEAWFELAWLEVQSGDANATLSACDEGLRCSLTEPQRALLGRFKALVERFALPGRGLNQDEKGKVYVRTVRRRG